MRHYRQNTAGKQKILMVQNSRIRIFALNNSHLHPTSNLFILIIELQFKYCHVIEQQYSFNLDLHVTKESLETHRQIYIQET